MESNCKCNEKLNYILQKDNYGQQHSEEHKKVVGKIVHKVDYYLDVLISLCKENNIEFICPNILYYKYEYPGPECYVYISWRENKKSLGVYFDNQNGCSAHTNSQQTSINSPEHLFYILKEIL